MLPSPSTAVPLVTTATRFAREVSEAASAGIGGDRETGDGDARRVGEREIVLGRERLRRLDGELSGLRQPVIGERARLEIVGYVGGHADSSRGGAPF